MRITKTNLEHYVAVLNSLSSKNYILDIVYGGYKICELLENSGEREISRYRLTARECFYCLDTMINYIENEKRD